MSSAPLIGHSYSDGEEVENRLAHAIDTSTDVSLFSDELRNYRTDWPSHYHLSPTRANLLRPLSHCLKGSIIEFGAGCGALTRYLGELGATVLAIEGSPRRANIAADRCRDLKNVRIIQDLIDNFHADSSFDAAILVGVLEYCRVYGRGSNPALDWLVKARTLLRKSGCLILAIENQLGLKYFAGVAEDHLGKAMAGIGDAYGPNTAVTFGRVEIQNLLLQAGFESVEFAVPVPDYKLPSSVILPKAWSDDNAGFDASALFRQAIKDDRQLDHAPLFSLGQAWGVVARNDLLLDLANSFLVVARPRVAKPSTTVFEADALAYHFASERRAHFCKQTVFRKTHNGISVDRTLLCPTVTSEPSATVKLTIQSERYVSGKNWGDALEAVVCRKGWTIDDLGRWLRYWLDALNRVFKDEGLPFEPDLGTKFPGSFIDAIPRNLIVDQEGNTRFIDLEWISSTPVDLGFLVHRALTVSLGAIAGFAPPANSDSINLCKLTTSTMNHLGFSVNFSDIERFVGLERILREEIFADGKNITVDQFAEISLPLLPDVTELIKSWNTTCQALATAQNLAVSRFRELTEQRDQLSATQNALDETQALAIDRFKAIQQLESAFREAQELALSRYDLIRKQSVENNTLQAALSEAQALAISRFDELAKQRNQLDVTDRALQEVQSLAIDRFQQISRLEKMLAEAQHSAAERASELVAAHERTTRLKAELTSVFASRSWRWTSGIRSFLRATRHFYLFSRVRK